MSEHSDVIGLMRESFADLHMDTPVENVLARSRARRRRRLTGLTAASAAAAGAMAAAVLASGGSVPAPAARLSAASPRAAALAAFSVTSSPGGETTVILRQGPEYQLDPSALRADLARHGIPALVSTGTFCRSALVTSSGINKVVHASTVADKSDMMVITGSALPPGTRLSIGYFPGVVRTAVIKDGAPLSCSSTFGQPTAHVTAAGTPIRTQGQP